MKVHPTTDIAPVGVYVYVLLKHPKHKFPVLKICRFDASAYLHDIEWDANLVPVGWIRCSELLKTTGIGKGQRKREHTARYMNFDGYQNVK